MRIDHLPSIMLIDIGPVAAEAEELGQISVEVKLLIFHSNSSFSIVNLRLAFTTGPFKYYVIKFTTFFRPYPSTIWGHSKTTWTTRGG